MKTKDYHAGHHDARASWDPGHDILDDESVYAQKFSALDRSGGVIGRPFQWEHNDQDGAAFH
jgi:hypothetical protein